MTSVSLVLADAHTAQATISKESIMGHEMYVVDIGLETGDLRSSKKLMMSARISQIWARFQSPWI